MVYSLFAHVVAALLDLLTIARSSERQKDVELLLLRQQLRIMHRKLHQPPRLSCWEKWALAILAARLVQLIPDGPTRLDQIFVLFKPATVLKWHRELVRWKWTYKRRRPPGRPRIAPDLEVMILQLAKQNPRWGYSKLHGELCKLGYTVSRSTVRNLLKRRKVPPAPHRARHGTPWRTFLGHYQHQIVACDFFTVETAWLKTIYVLFFIELGTRRVHLAGCTANPTATWVTQQARQLSWEIQDGAVPVRFLIHDRDAKFPTAFDTVFATEGSTIIRTPYQAPKANACAERWIRSVREECLDQLLILNERHLHRVLTEYVAYYNYARPHQGLNQQCPVALLQSTTQGPVYRRDVLGGIIHDYYRQAA
jgi:hypothetical protein